MKNRNTIAAFGGFRTIPPSPGGAGSDKFALELYPRLAKKGFKVIAYCRIYKGFPEIRPDSYDGVDLIWKRTVNKSGFDSLLHSMKATLDIILRNRAKYIHIHSGANSVWAMFLRMAGKKVILSQFAMDWKREKWPWYGKLYYRISNYLTAWAPNKLVFDNIYTRSFFERKFSRKYDFIPYGCEVKEPSDHPELLKRFGTEAGKYFLFVGRFIPDKGVHLLIEAFEKLDPEMKLLLVGGSPIPSAYETQLKQTRNEKIVFCGYLYGDDTNYLIKNAYAYIQPSLIEGLSPVILTAMGLGTPMICSDIIENLYITLEHSVSFRSGDSQSLMESMKFGIEHPEILKKNALAGKTSVLDRFNWDFITQQFVELYKKL